MKLAFAALLVCGFAQAQRKQLPEFVAGDQCLFCHRNDIGPTWQKNAHNLTVQPKAGSADEFTLGSRKHTRQLRKTGYGRFSIQEKDGAWNGSKFAERCAGCHTTAVNAETKVFTEFAIDCYACHGVVDLEHTNDTRLILLSKKNRGGASMITSICSSCHLRGGESKAKGLPYAYHFVPGDDLFADHAADLKKAEDPALNAGDRHVWRNVRDVLENNSETTCLSCHQVHANSAQKHRRVLTSPACLDCHYESGPKKNVKAYAAASVVCEVP
ncbi:MAG: hypothetical protein HY235_21140 [Acidobacteria bacterium]|nr:hypothetical protein [Acidobacteriota bacterium]